MRQNRTNHQTRPIVITPDFTTQAEGSVLVATGNTRVICTASVEEGVPGFLKGKNQGWVTAEYSMLPRATNKRTNRERQGASGRTLEIQRLIGRSLRAVEDLKALGERTITLDCDVIEADGGTRTASITGAYAALARAIAHLERSGVKFSENPLIGQVAAISLGIVGGELLLDLDYLEDSSAQVDLNLVMTRDLRIIEIQGTAEKEPFVLEDLNNMVKLAQEGLVGHFQAQSQVIYA